MSTIDIELPPRIAELAIPKGSVAAAKLCEICLHKATTKCEDCRVTHYCSYAHRLIDGVAFHWKVCKKMAQIRQEQPIHCSQEAREKLRLSIATATEEVVRLAEDTAQHWLLTGKSDYAYPASMVALNIATELWTPGSVEVIYPSCLVAEMYLLKEDSEKAYDYMAHASWVATQHGEIPPWVLIMLYRLKGLAFMASRRWAMARESFSLRICTLATVCGLDEIKLANAYGHLGLALMECGNAPGSIASFHRMADRWLEIFLAQYEGSLLRCATKAEMAYDPHKQELEFQFIEAKPLLKLAYEAIRALGMNRDTDLVNFKVLCVQAMSEMREYRPFEAAVFKQEALAAATRTLQDRAVSRVREKLLVALLRADYIFLWKDMNIRPRTVATQYLEKVKAIKL